MSSQQKFELKIPKSYGDEERDAIALEVIDFIIKRSKKGYDVDNSKFPKYSAGYKKSLDFKIAGKSGNVNLTLSGEMLNSIKLLESETGKLSIGFDKNDDVNNGKAEGNILGTYGSETPDSSKARNFLGISNEDFKKILGKFPVKTKADRIKTKEKAVNALKNNERATDIIDWFNPEDYEN